MNKEIKERIETIKKGKVPDGYKKEKWQLFPEDWCKPSLLNTVLIENKERNENLVYGIDDVLSVSGEFGVVNQVDLLGRSYAGESVAPYHTVYTDDIVYTKSPLKQNPHGIIKMNKGKPGIVSTLYAVYHCINPITAQYIETYFSIDSYLNNYLKPLVKRGAKNDMKVNNEDVLKGVIPLPPVEEQEKIAEILSRCDTVIEECEKQVEEYKNLKKTCLSKMFPKKGSNIPEIRFPGFTDAWEHRKLGEVLISLKNNTLSRADLSSEEGIAKNIHYGDILVKFGEVIDVKTESLPMIADETVIAKYKSSFLQNGDVIVADTAEDETVGKCTEIAGLSDEIVISGLHTIPYRPLQKYAPGYLGYYMNSASFHNQLLPLMQGIKVTSISKTALQNTDILYPKSATEQSAIGKYFRSLDNLITLHQRELEKLKNLKKACLEKMFV